MEGVASFLLGVFGSWIVSIFLVPLSEGKCHKWLVKYLGSYRQKERSISGMWTQCWEVDSNNFENKNEEVVWIKQFNKKIFTSFSSGGNRYFLAGTIDQDRFVTGTWYGVTKGDYHGSFQLHIEPNGKKMTGVWAGFSSTNEVKTGEWSWERAEQDTNNRIEPSINWS